MNNLAHMEGMMDSTMEHDCGFMGGGMALYGVLYLVLLIVLIVLGIMAIAILYKRNFSTKKKGSDGGKD